MGIFQNVTVTHAGSGFQCNSNLYGMVDDVSPSMHGCVLPHPALCVATTTLGCFNDTGLPVPHGAPCGSLFPQYQPQVHDRVTIEDCAKACWAVKATAAGIDAGNHCFCGDAQVANLP